MLSRELEETLRRAMSNAASCSHEFATLEHLLLALTEDSDALEVLHACNVDIDELVKKLAEFIEVELAPIVDPEGNVDVQPTASFQRVKWPRVPMFLCRFSPSAKAMRSGF